MEIVVDLFGHIEGSLSLEADYVSTDYNTQGLFVVVLTALLTVGNSEKKLIKFNLGAKMRRNRGADFS